MRTLPRAGRRLRFESLDARTMLAGTTAAVGPQANITAPSGAVHLTPSMTDSQVDNLVYQNPGKTFLLEAGTYHKITIAPLTGQTFIGAYGAVMSGEGAAYAFRSKNNNVTIQNIVAYGYSPIDKAATIHADLATGWTIDHVEVYGSKVRGITLYDGGKLTNSYIHDNAVLGVKYDGLAGYSGPLKWTTQGLPGLIQNNKISHNNPNKAGDINNEAGGLKLWEANNVTIADNTVDANIGHGIWLDTGRAGNVVKNNLSMNNTNYGIFNEITNGTMIDGNNLVLNKSGIYVASSANVTVQNNIISSSGTVTSSNYTRNEDNGGWKLVNLVVTNNTINNATTPTGSGSTPTTPPPTTPPPTTPPPSSTYAISGTVKSTTGAALSGVKVYLYDMNWKVLATVNTDSQGRYSFANLTAGSYRLGVYPGGYVKQELTQVVDGNETLNFSLKAN